jgi:hypothetical protein
MTAPWYDRAACKGYADRGKAWWWPPTLPHDRRETIYEQNTRVIRALEVCRRCPVKGPCWDAMAANGELSRRVGWVAGGTVIGGRLNRRGVA